MNVNNFLLLKFFKIKSLLGGISEMPKRIWKTPDFLCLIPDKHWTKSSNLWGGYQANDFQQSLTQRAILLNIVISVKQIKKALLSTIVEKYAKNHLV